MLNAYVIVRQEDGNKLTRLRGMGVYPSECNEGPFLRKFKYELFLFHRACITRRSLLRDQQRRHYVFISLHLPQQKSTCFSVLRGIN